jgi:hypothetical protein
MKKTYEKPKIIRVELRPEEAVLTACKSTGYFIGCCNTNFSGPPTCRTFRS